MMARNGRSLTAPPDRTLGHDAPAEGEDPEQRSGSMARVGIVATAWADGGAETYLRRLYGTLRTRGALGHLFGDIPRWTETGLSGQSVGSGPKWGRGTAMRSLRHWRGERRRTIQAIVEQSAKVPFDLFVAQYKREQITLSGHLSRLAPVVWTEHGRFLAGMRGRGLALAYRRASRSVAAVICVSEGVREDVAAVCGPGHPELVVIPNPVDLGQFRRASASERESARRSLGIEPTGGPVLVMVSRLHRAKRIDLAIEAVSRMAGAILVIAGDGPDRGRLVDLAPPGRVMFTGHRPDPSAVYASADVFVFTSGPVAREGSPMSIYEAAASGLPLVVTSGSGVEHHIKHGGVFVSAPRSDELAAAVRRAVGDAAAPLAARRWAEGHDHVSWAEKHAELFDAVIAGRARSNAT